MRQIPLTQGKYAIVDDEDYVELSNYKWCAWKAKNTWYVMRNVRCEDSKFRRMYMHRIIMKASKGQEIDHHNGNGLDNRKSNLRFCTHGQNMRNQRKTRGTSKYKGVILYRFYKYKHWRAAIGFNGKTETIGYFESEVNAAKAYDARARQLFGEFANTNFERAG